MAMAENYIGFVQEYMQKHRLALPTYSDEKTGVSHSPVFTCTVQVAGDTGGVYTCEGQGTKKKEAKNRAAKALYEKLKAQPLYEHSFGAAGQMPCADTGATQARLDFEALQLSPLPEAPLPALDPDQILFSDMLGKYDGFVKSNIGRQLAMEPGESTCEVPLVSLLSSAAPENLIILCKFCGIVALFRLIDCVAGEASDLYLCLLTVKSKTQKMERIVTHGSGASLLLAFRQALLAAFHHMDIIKFWSNPKHRR